MILMPPGSAKSTYASVLFPAWIMARSSEPIIGASHTADLAEGFSRKVMATIRDNSEHLGIELTREAVANWSTSNGAEYKAAGVGGPITGRRARLAIIDDPVKGRKVADSEVERETAWRWFWSDLRTRLKPEAAIVLIMTRWHMDDLGGRLLDSDAKSWRVLRLRAQAQAGEDDPLNRQPGEMLWSDDAYGYAAEIAEAKADLERAGAMRDWSALYQQNPVAQEGALFRVETIPIVDALPAGGVSVRGWDLAATSDIGTRDPDWTVGVRLVKHGDAFTVADVVRVRGGPDEVERVIVATAQQDGASTRISLPQDPGQAGRSQVLYLTRKLVGYRVESSPETGDKATRAAPVAAQANVGNVSLVRAAWNRAFLDELRDFPSGSKDDQVDALSRAFAGLIAPAAPARTAHIPFMSR